MKLLLREWIAFMLSGYDEQDWTELHPDDKDEYFKQGDRLLEVATVTPKDQS